MRIVSNSLLVLSLCSIIYCQIPDERCAPTLTTHVLINLSHETNCSLYYRCHLGSKYLMPACPKGLLFDSVTARCIREDIAICYKIDLVPTAPTAQTTITTTQTVTASTNEYVPTVPTVPTAPTGWKKKNKIIYRVFGSSSEHFIENEK